MFKDVSFPVPKCLAVLEGSHQGPAGLAAQKPVCGAVSATHHPSVLGQLDRTPLHGCQPQPAASRSASQEGTGHVQRGLGLRCRPG